ncbi:heavy-metal-associated domain-containing protein [Oceanisphaera pacifica]|uniref:Heavy-metal-associated domain-containing protein n=1 Tax=Oceanisphaera pacifica TaxID=2818389 RepID=A0ABS3NEC5_9GAMM|nr:heavy-metal-associated domain-containing protein [Oceanisphaera pacifica]MBO1518938.1 heavy-metal-associated domain-containing protein [Oceanisphaera pacifica]
MVEFTLPDMTCGHCVGAINEALTTLDPNCEIEFDLLNHLITVNSSATEQQLISTLTDAGYPPKQS